MLAVKYKGLPGYALVVGQQKLADVFGRDDKANLLFVGTARVNADHFVAGVEHRTAASAFTAQAVLYLQRSNNLVRVDFLYNAAGFMPDCVIKKTKRMKFFPHPGRMGRQFQGGQVFDLLRREFKKRNIVEDVVPLGHKTYRESLPLSVLCCEVFLGPEIIMRDRYAPKIFFALVGLLQNKGGGIQIVRIMDTQEFKGLKGTRERLRVGCCPGGGIFGPDHS